jgi:radical SAM/Cys-rich protein
LTISESQLADLENVDNIPFFAKKLQEINAFPLMSNDKLQTMQMNICRICNLSCKHCHVEAGPHRTEVMPRSVMERGLELMMECDIPDLDITGGCPELNPDFEWLIEQTVKYKRDTMVRTNLTILDDERFRHLPEFFAENNITISCSLPYYTAKNTDVVRGNGVFETSVKVIQRLNELGYGKEGTGLALNLVYNPGGAFMPAVQKNIEADYRQALASQFGVHFTQLFTIGNFPVGRFLSFLKQSGNLKRYMEKLDASFNSATVLGVMCLNQISLSWDGYLYDCDFNQMLGLCEEPKHISDVKKEDILGRPITVHNHCYVCTAGSGSSCGGAVV